MAKKATTGTRRRRSKPTDGVPKSLADLQKMTDGYLAKSIEMARRTTDNPLVMTAEEAAAHNIGIPFASFCLEYLTGCTAMPMGKMIEVVGLPKSNKSALCFDWVRQAAKLGGYGQLLEHESKYNGLFALSILQEYGGKFGNHFCTSINDWQKWIQYYVGQTQDIMRGSKTEPGPGKIFPYVTIVDSLMGKGVEESQDKIRKDGSAGRQFPIEALSIANYLRGPLMNDISGWPFIALFVNHLKEGTDGKGIKTKSTPGGSSQTFQLSMQFEMRRMAKIKTAKYKGNQIRLECAWNSFGESGRRIKPEILWGYQTYRDPNSGKLTTKQITTWDWHAATTYLLEEGEGKLWTTARELVDLKKVKKNAYYSSVLGGSRTEPITASEFGYRISSNPEIMHKLRCHFGIARVRIFQPMVDYDSQMGDGGLMDLDEIQQLVDQPFRPNELFTEFVEDQDSGDFEEDDVELKAGVG